MRMIVAIGLALALMGCGVEQLREVQMPVEPPPPVAEAPPALAPRSPVPAQPVAIRPTPAAGERAGRIVDFVPARGGPIRAPTPATEPAPPVGDITLRFEDTDIREVAAVVLRDILRVNYLIDPEVTGTVTLHTSRPLTRDQVLPVLEAALATRGASLIENRGLYRVVGGREGARAGQAPQLGPGRRGGEAGLGLQVFPLAFVTPSEMQKLLEPVLPRGRVVAADDPRGILLVAGNPQELAATRETIAIFDVDQMAGMSVLLTTLEHADATQMVPELNNLFGAATKGGEAGMVRFMAIERLNAVMVMSKQRRYVEDARGWIARLDRTRNANEQQLYVYYVQHGKAAEVAKTLRGVFGAEGGEDTGATQRQSPSVSTPPALETSVDRRGYRPPEGLFAPSSALPRFDPLPRTEVAPRPEGAPRAEPAADEGAAQPPLLQSAGRPGRPVMRIRADEAINAVLISATPRDFALIQQVLQQIDIAPLQVLIEATIFEVELRNQLRYGTQYFFTSGGLKQADGTRTLLTTGTSASGISPTVPGFSFSLVGSLGDARLIIEALSELTQLNVISSPQLLVLDNQTARLHVGDVVPIVTQTATSTLTNNPLIVNSIQYRDTGVTLEVTPRVNSNGLVTLDIHQTVSDVVKTTTSNIDSPTIRQRRILSSVAAQSGNTILLGGQIRENSSRSSSGIPFLNELPVVGALFGTKGNNTGRTELLVLLTPRVIRNQEEARDTTLEMRRKFQAVLNYEQGGVSVPRPVR